MYARADKGVALNIAETQLNHHGQDLDRTPPFLQPGIDALPAHIAILDATGQILTVNEAWRHFADTSGFALHNQGVGANYLDICNSVTDSGWEEARAAAMSIREIITGKREEFYLECPCHSPDEECWYFMRVRRFDSKGSTRLVVLHENITYRKHARRNPLSN